MCPIMFSFLANKLVTLLLWENETLFLARLAENYWLGFTEKLPETMVPPMKIRAFLHVFSISFWENGPSRCQESF